MTAQAVPMSSAVVRLRALDHVQSLLFDAPLAAYRPRIEQVVQVFRAKQAGGGDESTVTVQADAFGAPPSTADDIEVTDGIAVVPVRGTFTRRATWMSSMSGLTSYEQVTELIQQVAARSDVRGLVLAIDSPGGSVMGLQEAGDALAALEKPVYVVADGFTASAAYWLAVRAADRGGFFASPSAVVGSIGVYAVRLDASKADKDAGLAYTFVTAGNRKGDGDPHKPLTAAERDSLQARVDRVAQEFFAVVGRARRLDPDAIAALDGEAFDGREAVDLGLADTVGTVADAVAALRASLNKERRAALGLAADAQKEAPMATEKVDDEKGTEQPATDARVTPISDDPKIKAEIDRAAAQAALEAQEIVALCTHFGAASRATEFLAAKKSRAEVFEALQGALAQRDEATATNGAHGAGSEPAATRLDPGAYEELRRKAVLDANARRQAPLIA